MPISPSKRRLSGGVELVAPSTADVRVWAPACRRVELVIDGGASHELTRGGDDGSFEGIVSGVGAETRYWFRLDRGRLRPDPVSRYQPYGPHGPSAIVDAASFEWTDDAWKGVGATGHVLYEMHIGTFTPEGSWAAAEYQLEWLADLGITIIEMMPVADFPGRFGWGYDGVNLYAPTRLYGKPDQLRSFVNRAHALGVGVILDVVYNHLGPDGNYLADFSTNYFTDRYTNDWGRAINFEDGGPERALFVENAGYWIDEFHFDGLRFDATHEMKDASSEHVLASMSRRARVAARARRIFLVAENEFQETRLVRPLDQGGYGLDAVWNDDYHHTSVVALTGRREAYYSDYTGSMQELVSCAKYGYLYQGQWYSWQKKRRGTPAFDLPPTRFVSYLENHDQVANSAFGRRLYQLSSPARHRALTALTLLGPATPLLFQGQEFSSSAPFQFFADHREELRQAIRDGRRAFLSQFDSTADPEVARALPSPVEESTFQKCKLDVSERTSHASAYALHRDLLRLRSTHSVITNHTRIDGAVLTDTAMVLRYFGQDEHLLLILNLGADLDLNPAPEPLLAPPGPDQWSVIWSSESIAYGGQGTPSLWPESRWRILGEAAVLLGGRPGEPHAHD
jgi:maltooligosyltrehalose trehalohydrolase